MRGALAFPALLVALAASSDARFRVVCFSVQDDHVHLVVEASDAVALRGGARGLAVRLARAFNRACGRRGRVFSDRYHARALRTPREVRFAFVYVLHNVRKHQRVLGSARALDPCSSSAWFDGYREHVAATDGPTVAPRTWLARVGWRRHGLLSATERPRAG